MATHSSVLAWRIPGMAEPGGLPSMGLHRVRHNWSDAAELMCEIRFPSREWETESLAGRKWGRGCSLHPDGCRPSPEGQLEVPCEHVTCTPHVAPATNTTLWPQRMFLKVGSRTSDSWRKFVMWTLSHNINKLLPTFLISFSRMFNSASRSYWLGVSLCNEWGAGSGLWSSNEPDIKETCKTWNQCHSSC